MEERLGYLTLSSCITYSGICKNFDCHNPRSNPGTRPRLTDFVRIACRICPTVKKVSLRSDTAGNQEELLLYCGEGRDPRFGMIEFAIGADVMQAFRGAMWTTVEW
jgi:hypothetical protein